MATINKDGKTYLEEKDKPVAQGNTTIRTTHLYTDKSDNSTTTIKTFTGSGSFDVREEMIKDSTDLLDNVEVTTIAQECVKLKAKEDEIAKLEEKLKNKNKDY